MWDFKRLVVWNRTRDLVREVYRATNDFPAEERYGLVSQLRRAANSIGANIAEGCGRAHGRDRARFLEMAVASAEELEHHLIVAYEVGFIEEELGSHLRSDVDQIRRMLKALRVRSLSNGF